MERECPLSTAPDISHLEKDLKASEIFLPLSAPIGVQLELTSWCNQKCSHCYNYWRKDQEVKLIEDNFDDVLSKAVDQIIGNRIYYVTLTGGEPLGVLERAIPYLKKLYEAGVAMEINTNLVLLDESKMDLLKSIGIHSILTSLMSFYPQKHNEMVNYGDSFLRVTNNIKVAIANDFNVAVNMVVTKKNLDDVYKTAEYAKTLGVRYFTATKACTPINSVDFDSHELNTEEYISMLRELLKVEKTLGVSTSTLMAMPLCFLDTEELRDFYKDKSCSAGKITCTIGYDGQIRPCSHSSISYGNILNNIGLTTAWNNMDDWRTDGLIPSNCNDCLDSDVCRGGCRSEAYAKSGSLNNSLSDTTPRLDSVNDSKQVIVEESKITDEMKGSHYVFSRKVKYRSEDFGGILFVANTRWVTVDENLATYYLLNTNNPINISDYSNYFNCSLFKAALVFRYLQDRGIIEKGGE